MCLADLHIGAALLRARAARAARVRRRRRQAAAALAATSLALLPLACGGDDEPVQRTAPAVTGASDGADEIVPEPAPSEGVPAEDEPAAEPADDEAAITATLEALLSGPEPATACEDLVTDRYVKRAYGDTRGCTAAVAREKAARRVTVSEVVVMPDGVAQARVGSKGGTYDGQRLRAELVLDGGSWRVDRLRSNVPVGP